MSSVRNELRAKLLNEKVKKTVVQLEDGLEIEIRQMTVGQMIDSVNEQDMKKRMARYLLDCCYVPGSDDRVFEEADVDVLMNLPAGGRYQQLMDAVNEQLMPNAVDRAGKA